MYKDNNGIIKDTFNAFLVENANFTETEEYPILKKDMISKDIPKNIISFQESLNYKGNLKETFICFYAQDQTFERVRKNPKRYIEFFGKFGGIIGFDYSIHSDMPIIKQKSQMNDNLSLTYYYGNNGIKIIPNIRCGIDELLPEFLDAIPKESLVAIGTYGFIKEKQQQAEWYCNIKSIIDNLNPVGIIVYGTLPKMIYDEFKSEVNFCFFDSWSKKRTNIIKNNHEKVGV